MSAVKGGDGTIGYADASQAGDLGQAKIKVGSEYVGPSAEAASKVLDESKPAAARPTPTSPSTSTARPPPPVSTRSILVSYQIICSTYKSQDEVDLVKGFASYVISEDGQNAAADAAGSAPITDSIREQAQAAIDQIAASS